VGAVWGSGWGLKWVITGVLGRGFCSGGRVSGWFILASALYST